MRVIRVRLTRCMIFDNRDCNTYIINQTQLTSGIIMITPEQLKETFERKLALRRYL